MVSKKVNEDLQKERNKCDFNVEELTNFLDGGAHLTASRREMVFVFKNSKLTVQRKFIKFWFSKNKVLSVKGLRDEIPDEYLSHKDKYENAIRKSILYQHIMEQVNEPNLNEMERIWKHYRSQLEFAVFKDNYPFSLHFVMFIPTIIGMGTEEQQKYWLKRARNMEIIGTYAQTELGHGTFIRGLETRATYDPQTEEFILHSPSLTAYKWWPGGLGHTANYCVVMAQLYIKGKNYGIQPFVVQIRDEVTHIPLSGVQLGEIGAKLGLNTVNNGFLAFENHRISRDRMLMKNAQVSIDGTFTPSTNNKLTYGTMVFVRVMILNTMANYLARAATVAVRYSAVRHQSQPKPDEPEPQILDYVTQQHKLFISIATSHAFTLTALWLWDMYKKVNLSLQKGEMDGLPELHALACCLKAVSTSDAASLVERCRLACGGHGYMLSSNLPQTYGLTTAACTYEGENTVLMLQSARSLFKAWEQAASGKPLPPTIAYLSDKSVLKWDGSVDCIVKSFQRVAAGKLTSAVRSMKTYVESGLSLEDAWNKVSVQLVAASDAHCRAFILSTYRSEVRTKATSLSAPLQRSLNQLVELYSVYWSLEKFGDLLLYAAISESDIIELQRNYERLLEQIRPNAVGLVDAFDYRDEILNSALGAYDGRVYERLMEEALKSPLNSEPVNQSFHKYLKPFMQGKL